MILRLRVHVLVTSWEKNIPYLEKLGGDTETIQEICFLQKLPVCGIAISNLQLALYYDLTIVLEKQL